MVEGYIKVYILFLKKNNYDCFYLMKVCFYFIKNFLNIEYNLIVYGKEKILCSLYVCIFVY